MGGSGGRSLDPLLAVAVQLTFDSIGYNTVTVTLSAKITTEIHECVAHWMSLERMIMVLTGFLAAAENSMIDELLGTGRLSLFSLTDPHLHTC